MTFKFGLPALTGIKDFFLGDSNVLKSQRQNCSSPAFHESSSKARFGSSLVPLEKENGNHLKSLVEARANSALSPVVKFNLLTASTALALMHLAGLRGIEAGSLNVKKMRLLPDGSAILIVLGKSNKKFTEWRLAYLPAPFGELISIYRQKAQEFFDHLVHESLAYPALLSKQRGDAFLFFADETGAIKPLTRRTLKQQITEILPARTGCESYLWKINAPRQYFAFTAFELKLPRRMIDALMGHSSQGSEALGRFSALSFEDFKNASRRVAKRVSAKLGIDPAKIKRL